MKIMEKKMKRFKMPVKAIVYFQNADIESIVTEVHEASKTVCTRNVKQYRLKEYYYRTPFTFDIETTAVKQYDNAGQIENARAYMYIWQCTLGDYLIKGRTWPEWWELVATIERVFELGRHKVGKATIDTNIILWIHNLPYEFSFMARQRNGEKYIIKDAFAAKPRKPITATIGYHNERGIVCMDSMQLSGGSLAQLAKDYCSTPKMVTIDENGCKQSDLDYSKPRNSKTPLTPTEDQYCDNDVIILNEWARAYDDMYLKEKCRPLTKTAVVRLMIDQEYQEQENRSDLNTWLFRLFPDLDEYRYIMSYLYRGGYTHSNYKLSGQVHEDVHGMDFTSSYPAVMLQYGGFPMTPFVQASAKGLKDPIIEEDFKHFKGLAWYAEFEFENIRPRTMHSVESICKIFEFYENRCDPASTVNACGIIADNGRILAADHFTVCLNNVDFEVYKMFYVWDSCTISHFRCAETGYLPEYFQNVVKHAYKNKSKMKGTELEGSPEYNFAKQVVNACYGCSVQHVHFSENVFTPEGNKNGNIWGEKALDNQEAYEKALGIKRGKNGAVIPSEPKTKLSPYWGIYITSVARLRILQAIRFLDDDCIYSDTDSVYFKNYEKNAGYFEAWNAGIETINRQLFGADFDTLGDLGTFDPVAIKGKDAAGNKTKETCYTFATLGAKRYVKYDRYYNIEQTIAGLTKHALEHTIQKRNNGLSKKDVALKVVETFLKGLDYDLELTVDEAEKKTHCYNDAAHSDMITDEFGNSELMHEESSTGIFEIPFTMKLEDSYACMLLNVLDEMEGL